ncbi:MAG: hypothetical protein ACE1ZE_06040 [Candidatus Binatia bacterium]
MDQNKNALGLEDAKLQKLRGITNLTVALLSQADLSLLDAQKLIAQTRSKALELFPDKGDTFDLIYGSRFRRILAERFRLQ